ncbi:1-acyl-sn-glycerol-3-phosphate acyltransferase [Helicobacter sp. 16-1353]|uniref:lysophospholipid acyltransferase family protein n=1 Tax=Helicobacter sp. 16-1353 TaxID=2004996 RepID=UPI000DCE7E0A|nr:lysophospholipid acyltransferase family protein [Helicobacter sp. 16-1353]RAX54305.1 1-acyl-sn-glycerol-3-phosphate acyltransferase [Helicobacter sp. 16-1353]
MILARIRGIWATINVGLILPIIIAFIYIFRPINRAVRKTSRVFFWLNGISVERIGEFDKSAQILVLNHQGIIDIAYLEAYYPWDICWVAKKELGEPFIYGHALKGPRMILIDRESKKSLIYLLKEAKDRIEKGRILGIFPEGTRSKGGREFLEFKSGAKILIEKYNLKIQPIIAINTRKLFDDKKIAIFASRARMVCLEAYKPDFSNPNWYEELRNKMHEVYIKNYDEMNGADSN